VKKKLWILVLCGLSFTSNAQTANSVNLTSTNKVSVEKSTFSIQTGFLGIWVNNESRLSNSFVLRSEIGFAAKIWGSSYQKTGFLLTPVFRLEPRWYYNLRKRASKSKRIDGNSGNYLALQTSYYPGGRAISNYDNVNMNSVFIISPMWGIQRNIGRHFNYNAGVGLGYVHYFADKSGYGESSSIDLTAHRIQVLKIYYSHSKPSLSLRARHADEVGKRLKHGQ